ncbi:MAG: heat-inducible transcriptional repressor HrcA [Peptoanaerobacter stomatis]|uniref:heat-inducible transcriptional repressor HrcA n=1 Tax=Peptoanaerobacter stomatis TaxID=796937 RepID=UPI003FA0F07A
MNSKLSERKLKILQFIVEEYINTAEPVGSRTISKNKELSISAATIRNEMSDLEEMGFLLQPHVSSGRVPSPLAYSLYVDELMKGGSLDIKERELIKTALDSNINQIQSLLDETVNLLSSLTNCTSIAIMKNDEDKKEKISHFELVKLNEHQIIMIIVMEDGRVNSKNIYIDRFIESDKLQIISQTIKEEIIGKDIKSLGDKFVNYVKSEIMQYDELLDNMLETINSNLSQDVPFSIMLKGTKNIFNYPEFNDIDTVKSFLTLFDNKDELVELVQNQGVKKDNINIIIGDKSMGDLLDNCSIITANFELKGNNIGKFGIIGPKRMDYGKAYSLMKYITKYISEVF